VAEGLAAALRPSGERAGQAALPFAICRILANRGLRTADDAKRFLRPAPEHLSSPETIADLSRAAARLAELLGGPKAPRDSAYPLAIGTIVRAFDQMSCEKTRRPKLSPPTSPRPASLDGG